MIGIAISTYLRPEVFSECYKNMLLYLPKGAKVVVVSDADENPPKESDFVFTQRAGVNNVKNKCLELLEGCDDIFLFDSDTYPKKKGWELPYIKSKEPHLMYIFKDFADRPLGDTNEIYRDSEIVAYNHPRGCMLYFKKEAIDKVGGFDTRFPIWGGEHKQLSDRIYNNGLTSFRYADVINSKDLIYSGDEHEATPTTVGRGERVVYLRQMQNLVEEGRHATHYCEYKTKQTKPLEKQKNLILTSFFTNQTDVQRNTTWQADKTLIEPLINSCLKNNANIVVLNDCFEEDDTFKRVHATINPYFQRWLSQYQYLRDHPEIDNVFVVDSTDVELLKNPFPHIDNRRLYVGDEKAVLGNNWIMAHSRHEPVRSYVMANKRLQLLNCGVVGGSRENVMQLCHDVISMYFDNKMISKVEMPIFNYLCYTKYGNIISHGREVTNVFKSFDKSGDHWFAHK